MQIAITGRRNERVPSNKRLFPRPSLEELRDMLWCAEGHAPADAPDLAWMKIGDALVWECPYCGVVFNGTQTDAEERGAAAD